MTRFEDDREQPEDASSVSEYLNHVLAECGEDTSGEISEDIPAPGATDPALHALALVTADGSEYGAGDDEHYFTIQSISKPFVYALALDDSGLERVHESVGTEPSGEAFNELSLEGGTGRPLNPMINAGAIVTHQLVNPQPTDSKNNGQHTTSQSPDVQTRTARIVEGLSAFAGRDLKVDHELAEDEYSKDYRNLAIAHMLKTHDVLATEPEEAVRGYTDQCCVLVTVRDLARMAATLANNGVHPETGERVVSEGAARRTLSVMATCGMYDGSGRWLARIGIPAKSGISGGIIGVLPGQVGLASFAPRLDDEGNSIQGVEMFARLCADLGLHLMASERRDVAQWLKDLSDDSAEAEIPTGG
ncbi:glutaminase A [Nesterenkonia natronophila]|uniref:Glutaminase n=1 Tax=Nesterenkonia natronophila TaxID=2174932 RepID=A0A3A4FKK8_9MICC|nr:glutaminase A [Nesterenkonia natronophila]RJN32955.1 glutaminase A [Nesterenkonia natronophila]